MRKLFIVVNVDWFFLSHRLPIALAAKERGFEVTIVTKDSGKRSEIEEHGLKFCDMPFERSVFNPIKEYLLYLKLKKMYKKEQPDIVHHVTLKPMILGSLAAKCNPNISIVNAVSGLGILFSSEGSKLKRFLVLKLLRKAFDLKNKVRVIFQNPEDRSIFLNAKLIEKEQAVFIKGSGVNLEEFSYSPPQKEKKRRVFMAARLLYPKGFKEFFLAAKYIKSKEEFKDVDFIIAGGLDDINPSAIQKSTINQWEETGSIKWIGFSEDMKKDIALSDVVVFPSYYGEGVPKFLIETCAIGRPIITTNHAGCRDCVEHGKNGYLVPSKDHLEMAEYLMNLLRDPQLCEDFGLHSRLKAENEFSIELVTDIHMKVYQELAN